MMQIEETFFALARGHSDKKVLVICDRGCMDASACEFLWSSCGHLVVCHLAGAAFHQNFVGTVDFSFKSGWLARHDGKKWLEWSRYSWRSLPACHPFGKLVPESPSHRWAHHSTLLIFSRSFHSKQQLKVQCHSTKPLTILRVKKMLNLRESLISRLERSVGPILFPFLVLAAWFTHSPLIVTSLQAWVGHPYFDVIDNSTDFEGKLLRTIEVIDIILHQCRELSSPRRYLLLSGGL